MTDGTRRMFYKWIYYGALMLVCLLLQTTVFSRISVLHCSPSLLPFIVATIVLIEGSVAGASAGLMAGFMYDAVFALHDGFYTVVLPVLAVVICFIDKFMYWKNYGMAILNWIMLLLFQAVIYCCVFLLVGGRGGFSSLLLVLPGEVLATAPFTPFLYILIKKISETFSQPDDT